MRKGTKVGSNMQIIWVEGLLFWYILCFCWGTNFQERTLALAENRSVPSLYTGSDVRPLKMEDFKRAHDQVNSIPLFSFVVTYFGCCSCYSRLFWWSLFRHRVLFGCKISPLPVRIEILLNVIHFAGMCKCCIRLGEYEWTPPVEWFVWRMRFEKEGISELLHVDGRVYSSCTSSSWVTPEFLR